MSFSPRQKKKIIILFFAAFILLAANIAWEVIFEKPERFSSVEAIDSVKSDFLQMVKNFGLEEDWIIENDIILRNKFPDAKHLFRIKVPSDLPIVNIIRELNLALAKEPLLLKSYELNKSGEAEVILTEREEIIIASKFVYDTLISRNAGNIAFILHNQEQLTSEEDSALLHLPSPFAVTLIPSGKSARELDRISSLRKECVLLLNDEITELKYRIDKSMSLNRLRIVLRSLVEDFSGAAFLIVTPEFPLLQSSLFIELVRYFNDRNIKVVNSSSLLTLDELTEPEMILKEVLQRTGRNDSAIFFCSAETFGELLDDLAIYKKTGYKIVRPSAILLK